jgi:cytoskeletal protein CcmA (bactofilin family)
MLRSESLFGKRDGNTAATPANPPLSTTMSNTSVKPMGSSPSSSSLSSSKVQESSVNNNASTNEVGSKLIVGPNIKLKGVEITDCDTLVVEGRVEATMDSRVIQIAEKGAFKGSAEIDVAEIRGEFDGELTVREKLVIFATGKVSGKIRYGKLVIEEGGQIAGDVQVNTATAAAAAKRLNVA